MFRSRRATQENAEGTEDGADTASPKYTRPKILLIDLKDESEQILTSAGYSVQSGTFGSPYRVEMGDKMIPVIATASLPGHTESDIVVVDLEPPSERGEPLGAKHVSEGEDDWWASCSRGVVDPRPRVMCQVQNDFDRLLAHGSVFIVFARPRRQQDLQFGHPVGYSFHGEPIKYNNWSFLSALHHYLEAPQDHGTDISLCAEASELGPALRHHIEKAQFWCTLYHHERSATWIPLAVNRFDDPVSGLVVPDFDEYPQAGFVLILPEVKDKAALLLDLLHSWLPDVAPHLFPHVEGARWVQRAEYELPEVLALRREIERIQTETKERITELEARIDQEREELWFLHALLRDTGDDLVEAVKESFAILGFTFVVDADEEIEAQDSDGFKREDLRIEDRSTWLLVEVKGIQSRPRDEDALQVAKYLAPRMKEFREKDIQGLSIINHERHLPALERDNANVFREDVVAAATEQYVALMTTWDLYRLVRGVVEYDWPRERVQDILYEPGRVEPVPGHYEFIGTIERHIRDIDVIGIDLQEGILRQGDRIAFALSTRYVEQYVESLQVDNEAVDEVTPRTLAGIKTTLGSEQVEKGAPVYRVEV